MRAPRGQPHVLLGVRHFLHISDALVTHSRLQCSIGGFWNTKEMSGSLVTIVTQHSARPGPGSVPPCFLSDAMNQCSHSRGGCTLQLLVLLATPLTNSATLALVMGFLITLSKPAANNSSSLSSAPV